MGTTVRTATRLPARIAVAVGLAGSLLAAGCGTVTDPTTDAATAPPDPVADAAERLAGRYAHFDVVAYQDSTMRTQIISYGFSDLTQVGGRLVERDSFCFSEHRSDQPISVTFSDAATRAITPVPVEVELTVTDERARIIRPATPTGIGVALANPATDPLPTDPADPRIVDADGDGHPGVTASISAGGGALTGDLYLARREIFAYDLAEQADGSLRGVVRDGSEQLVIDTTNEVFRTPAQWIQDPDLSRSPIVLVPVEGDWDCERLRRERPTLLPPVPPIEGLPPDGG